MEQAGKNKKSSTKKSNITARRKGVSTYEASASQNPIMDRIMVELKHIREDMLRLPELCAQVQILFFFCLSICFSMCHLTNYNLFVITEGDREIEQKRCRLPSR